MSTPIFSRAAPVEIGPSLVPPRAAEHVGSRPLRPGQRIIAGRVFYSAAWLDQATSTFSEPLYATMTAWMSLTCNTQGRGLESNQRPWD